MNCGFSVIKTKSKILCLYVQQIKTKVILRYYFLILLLIFSALGYSQTYSVSGIIEDENKEALPFVNVVVLKQADSSIVKGGISDEMGKFEIPGLEEGNYIIRSSFVGFETAFTPFELNSDLTLPTINLMTQSENLDEVTLTYRKPTVRRDADKLVFNIAGSSLTEGNIVDALRSTPSVLIMNDVITVRNSRPEIYINDRKVNLSSQEVIDLLQGTPAQNIQEIEVITNPSARYDADSGVVLNIKMSRNVIAGYSGSLFSNYTQGVFPKYNFGSTNFFKSKKFGAYINYSYNQQKINKENDEIVNYPDEVWRSDINRNSWRETHTVGLNLDYEFDEKNYISLTSNLSFLPYFKYQTRNRTFIQPPPGFGFASFNADNLSRDLKNNLGFNLDYTHNFSSDSKLMFNAHYTLYDYGRDQRVSSDYFRADGEFIENNTFTTRSDQDTDIFTTQLDYSISGEGGSFETGVKLSRINTMSGITRKNIENGEEVIDQANSTMFDYEEDIYAAYANLSKTWDKWSLDLGVRAEQTDLIGRSVGQIRPTEQNYLEWFPNGNLTYKISDKTSIYGNYRRSIQRPDYNYLNPFQFFINDNTVVTGNPGLQPIFIEKSTLGLTTGVHTFEIYYKTNESNIYEIPIQDNENNIVTYTPFNLSNTVDYGIDYTSYFNVNDKWSMFIFASVFYIEDEAVFNDINVTRDMWTLYSDMTNSFNFLKDRSLSADLTLTYISSNIQGLQVVDGRFLTDLSVRKTIMKGNGILSLAVSDFFNTHDFLVKTKFLDQDSSIASDLDNRFVRVGFRYKFGNTKLSSEEKTLSKDELDRLNARN